MLWFYLEGVQEAGETVGNRRLVDPLLVASAVSWLVV